MTQFLLTLDEQVANETTGYDEVFLWSGVNRGTFSGPLDPHLAAFGSVRDTNVDFVRIALGVFAADRSVHRKARGSDWNARDLHLSVEVNQPQAWTGLRDELAGVVGFLTGDRWAFDFLPAAPAPETPQSLPIDESMPTRTVLLSGGADSAAGALLSALDLPRGERQLLVSHFSAPAISPFQKNLVGEINRLAPHQTSSHRQVNLNRTGARLDGSSFKNEASSRSRSLLFLALGLASAEPSGEALLIPENGFASLNPPLGPERRGALSTHTTHPRFLADLETVLSQAGAHGQIENPFRDLTKGEMFARVAERIGRAEASAYLSGTNSCAHTDGRYSHAPSGSSCGVCFGCLVRRASFHAAGLDDATEYLVDDPQHRYDEFVAGKSIIEAMRDFCAADVKPRMVMSMSLPDGYSPSEALDLCRRGVGELREYLA